MPLNKNMTLPKIKEYLQGDLKQSIKNDIRPIIQPDREEGGYFGVARLVLSYIDFLGALYCGYERETDSKGPRKIAQSSKAIRFIKDVLCSVDSLYGRNADLLYNMYRHGTVHLYEPKKLKCGRRKLRWLLYKGQREDWVFADGPVLKVRHMEATKVDGNSYWLPVSITCLYDDLLASIDHFCRRLEREAALRDKWRKTANALCAFEDTTDRWW